jgi:hypothetical protein
VLAGNVEELQGSVEMGAGGAGAAVSWVGAAAEPDDAVWVVADAEKTEVVTAREADAAVAEGPPTDATGVVLSDIFIT